MPYVRGRILPEAELSGRAKSFLDVLLWMDQLGNSDIRALDELEVLRIYLYSMRPLVCQIRLWVPRGHAEVIRALEAVGIDYVTVVPTKASQQLQEQFKGAEPELAEAVSTAQVIDADCLVTNRVGWFPFIEAVEKFFVLLTDCSFLLPYSEIFVRGHEVPWAFEHKVWNTAWTVFYLLSETRTFEPGLRLLHKAFQKKAPADAQETGRSLVYNRLANLCFTRDRLLFYEIQRLAAKRAGWKRQGFGFEIAYYLNFNYLLIYGAFDHAALFASQLLNLGLAPREVGATYKRFLELLKNKSASLHAVFIRAPIKRSLTGSVRCVISLRTADPYSRQPSLKSLNMNPRTRS